MTAPIRIEVDGRAAGAADLWHPALVNLGHFTSMQVRRGRTRGLDLHLRRLVAATDELFDAELDPDQVRAYVRHALGDTAAATVRVSVFAPDDRPVVLVAIRPPADHPTTSLAPPAVADGPRVDGPAAPQALRSVAYQRPVPHLKHVGSFGQIYHGRAAARQGFDDALLTAPDGTISEAGMSNVGFVEAGAAGPVITWPDAPCLAGITMQLLDRVLPAVGLPTRRRPLRLADLPAVTGAFVANANGIAPVGRIDDLTLPVDDRLMRTVIDAYTELPQDLV